MTKIEVREEIVTGYLRGTSLQEIATIVGLSRERVRQIAVALKLQRQQPKTTRSRLVQLGKEMAVNRERTPTGAFARQRQNARQRGIPWNLSLDEWWAVWESSGKWHLRGRGSGYVMSRYGDKGAYQTGNVFIQAARINNNQQGNRWRGSAKHGQRGQ